MDDTNSTEEIWLTIPQAVKAYRKSERTLRRLLAMSDRGGLVAKQVATPKGFQWYIAPPLGYQAHHDDIPANSNPETAMIPVASVPIMMSPFLQETIKELDRLRDEVQKLNEARLEDERQHTQNRLEDERRHAEERRQDERRHVEQMQEKERRIAQLETVLGAPQQPTAVPERQQRGEPLQWPKEPSNAVTDTPDTSQKPRRRFFWQS